VVPPAAAMAVRLAAVNAVPPVPMVSSVPPVGGSDNAMSTLGVATQPGGPEKTS